MSSKFNYKTVLIAVGAVALTLGIAFGGGVAYGRSSAPQSQLSVVSSGNSGRGAANSTGGGTGNGQGSGRQGGGGQGLGRPVAGSVKSVDGDTITISTQNNGDVKVQLSSSATIVKEAAGSSSDIQPGQFVLARGQQNADGSLTANTVNVGPANLVGGNRFGQNTSQ